MQSVSVGLREKLEYLKFISQIHRSQFTERTKYEWKIVSTTLTFYVLSVVAVYSGRITLSNIESGGHASIALRLIIPGMFLFLAAVIAAYLGYVHMGNNKNKTFAENAEHSIRDLLEDKMPQTLDVFLLEESKHWVSWDKFWKKTSDGKHNRGMSGWIGQAVTIFIFAFTTILLIYCKI